jgi:hypothetical protein
MQRSSQALCSASVHSGCVGSRSVSFQEFLRMPHLTSLPSRS